MKKALYLFVSMLVIAVLFGGLFWYYEVEFLPSKANETTRTFSIDNSYLFVTPLEAKANDNEKIRVTVFVLNSQGLGVQGRVVHLSYSKSLTYDHVQVQTDEYGKAIFDISSRNAGEYALSVDVDGSFLNQKAKLVYK